MFLCMDCYFIRRNTVTWNMCWGHKTFFIPFSVKTSVYCTSYWSIQSKVEIFARIFNDFYLYKLNYDVKQYRTPWPWIHSTSLRLERFFRFDCCRVEQCNDSCDKENVFRFVAKKSESIAVESGFIWSQCWIGGSTHLYNPPYSVSIWVTARRPFAENENSCCDGDCICLCLNLRSVDSQRG